MKECNIPFCKEIPDTWKEVPNKYLFDYHSVRVGDKWKDYQLLSLTTSGVKEKDINASGGKVPDSYDKYQTVEPGDMIFCLFDLDVSAVFSGLSHHYGMITSAYDVVRPNHKLLNQNFSDFWFQYVFTNRYYKMYSKNIRFTIGTDMFKAISTPIPPMEQQRKIADFLNKKTEEIDLLIDIENQQIEKLKEYKQAVVTQAVTKGLDKNAIMKDSGVKWIGKVPNTWKSGTIKRVTKKITCGVAATPEYVEKENGVLFLSAQNIQNDKIDLSTRRYINNDLYNKITKNTKPEKGDLLQVRVGASIGKCAIIDIDDAFGIYVSLSLIKPNELVISKFLYYYLQTSIFRKMSELYIDYAGSQGNLNVEDIKKIYIPIPSIKEQEAICDYIDCKVFDLNKIIEIKQQKIEKLEDYKKSFIYEYVTGKKEVIA